MGDFEEVHLMDTPATPYSSAQVLRVDVCIHLPEAGLKYLIKKPSGDRT